MNELSLICLLICMTPIIILIGVITWALITTKHEIYGYQPNIEHSIKKDVKMNKSFLPSIKTLVILALVDHFIFKGKFRQELFDMFNTILKKIPNLSEKQE